MQYIPLLSQNESTSPTIFAKPIPISASRSHFKFSKRFLILLSFLFLFLLYFLLSFNLQTSRLGSRAIDTLALSLKLQKHFYVVVLDAGSTGSRALVFRFHEEVLTGNLVLDDEKYLEKKPGLSSYPTGKEAADSLIPLLDKVKAEIPEAEWKKTPLTLRATAGLRLLKGDKAQEILSECRKLLESTGFQVSLNSVSIMEGTDEGIFSWFTVNFLLDRFSEIESERTVAALDLGGGSTQVTFAPTDAQKAELGQHVYSINVFNRNMSIFTRSYLGMGLMAARKGILIGDLPENHDTTPEVRSACINPIIRTTMTYGNRNYIVMGPVNGTHKVVKTQNFAGGEEKRPVVDWDECKKIVQEYVKNGIGGQINGLKGHEVYAFSYYFDRATEVALVDPFLGGKVSLNGFYNKAMETCDDANTEQPFICLDLTYIYVLLKDGFGVEPYTKLNLYKKISGHELSWALGAAFNIVQNGL